MNTILFLATTQLVLAFQDARQVLVVATPSMDEPRLIRSVGVASRAGANVRVLLAPKADYLVEKGQLLIGSDPYASAQREFKALLSSRASILVDPRFSEAGATSVRTGVRSGMSFAAMGTGIRSPRVSIICTGAMDSKTTAIETNVCVQTDDASIHKALMMLHNADFDDTQTSDIRENKTDAAKQRLVISPGSSKAVEQLVAAPGAVRIYTAKFDAASPIGKLLIARGSKATLVVPPSSSTTDPSLLEAAANGVIVTQAARPFSGSFVEGGDAVFIGSQAITVADFDQNRHVGVVIGKPADGINAMLGARK